MGDEPKGDLQFDRADFEGAATANTICSACNQTISSVYFAVNGSVLCESCKTNLDLTANQGTSLGRFLRAAVYGAGAGAVGSGIWYAVRAGTGYEVGLIAVAVGFMVGAAVRKGSNGRGGWRYQALAMFLTYASIVSSYVPDIVTEIGKMGQSKPDHAGVGGSAATPSASPAPTPQEVTVVDAGEAPDQAGSGGGLLLLVLQLVFLVGLVFAAPFLGGFENIMGIVIIGIGVYEAWKLNKTQMFAMTGPHKVGAAEHG